MPSDARRMSQRTLQSLALQYRRILGSSTSGHVAWQGGEPTLCGLEFFREAVCLFGPSVSHTLQTSGLLLTDEWVAWLAQEKWLVGISFDGPFHDQYRGPGTSARVRAAMRRLSKAGVPWNVLCVVTDEAARAPELVYRSLAGAGARCVQFMPAFGGKDAVDPRGYARFLRAIRRLWSPLEVSIVNFEQAELVRRGLGGDVSCLLQPTCGQYLVVEYDGSLYPCDHFVTSRWRLGSIHEKGLAVTWRTSRTLREFRALKPAPADACELCEILPLCHRGCPWYRGPFLGRDIHCEAHRVTFGVA